MAPYCIVEYMSFLDCSALSAACDALITRCLSSLRLPQNHAAYAITSPLRDDHHFPPPTPRPRQRAIPSRGRWMRRSRVLSEDMMSHWKVSRGRRRKPHCGWTPKSAATSYICEVMNNANPLRRLLPKLKVCQNLILSGDQVESA
jgi:hypothetical protein